MMNRLYRPEDRVTAPEGGVFSTHCCRCDVYSCVNAPGSIDTHRECAEHRERRLRIEFGSDYDRIVCYLSD